MSIKLEGTYPPQPSTERARRTPLAFDPKNRLLAYGSGKLVVVRAVDAPERARATYTEHLQPVTSVAFSPSGFYAASGDASGQVRVWNTDGDEFITKGPYQATSARINGIAWCHESSRVLAVGDGKERYGHAFTADSGNTVGEISGHAAMVNAVAVRPGRPMRAVTVGEDGNTIFYEGPPFRFARSISKHTNSVSDVAYAPDGAHFVTGGCDRKVGLYDGKTGDFLDWLPAGHEGMVLSVAFASPTLVLSASADCSVRLTDVAARKLVHTWQLPKTLQNQQTGVVAVSPELFVSVALGGDLCYWSPASAEPVRRVQGHQKPVTALALSATQGLVSGSIDGSAVRWDAERGGERLAQAEHEGPVSSLFGDLWSAGWDRKIVKLGEAATTLEARGQPLGAALAAGDRVVAVSDELLEVVGTDTSAKLGSKGTTVHAVGDLVAVGHGVHAALYRLPALELVHRFDARQAEVSAVQISPDAQLVAVGDASGKILLYTTSDFAVKTSRWTFHTSRVTAIRWLADSSRVVTSALDTNIYIYNVEKPGRTIKVLGAHKDGVTAAGWDGESQIVSGGSDGCVKQWRVEYS